LAKVPYLQAHSKKTALQAELFRVLIFQNTYNIEKKAEKKEEEDKV
jgi:hypothetical protein